MVAEGQTAPNFTLPADEGADVSLSALRGKPVIVYWYPKDDTPGCTKEACAFRDVYTEFEQAGAAVVGISADSVASHQAFKAKYHLPFPLLSDTDHRVAEQYGVWGKQQIGGREMTGIHRTTFLLDKDGTVTHVWREITPESHADEILAVVRTMSTQ